MLERLKAWLRGTPRYEPLTPTPRPTYQPPRFADYTRNPVVRQREAERTLQESAGRLIVHHLSYQNHRNEHEHLEDLVTVCAGCHGAAHSASPWLQAPPQPYYTEFVSSPYWHEVRKAVLRRDGWRCQGCGSAGHTPDPVFTMPRTRRGALNALMRLAEES